MYENIGRSLGTDYFLIADQLTGESWATCGAPATSWTTRCCR
jgi:hypothetical protein